MNISDNELVAYHEAGHAVAALEFRHAFVRVSIKPEGTRGGYVELPPWPGRPEYGWLEQEAVILLAGPAALGVRLDLPMDELRSGDGDASHVYGIGRELLKRGLKDPIDGWFLSIRAQAFCLVTSPWTWVQIDALAQALLQREMLDAKDVCKICRASRRDVDGFLRLLKRRAARPAVEVRNEADPPWRFPPAIQGVG